jgi:polysaccharide export outer membrane protein
MKSAILATLLVIFTAHASAQDSTATAVDPAHRDARYHLCASDVIAVTFPLTPEFDQTISIQPDGFASLTGVGDVHLEGLTTQESAGVIRSAYANILEDPIVTVDLKDFNKPYFIVSGEVNRPGKYDLRGDTRTTQAIAIAGGFNDTAKHSQVLLFRQVNDDWYEVRSLNVKKILQGHNVNEDAEIRSGDMLYGASASRFWGSTSFLARNPRRDRCAFFHSWPRGFRSWTPFSP